MKWATHCPQFYALPAAAPAAAALPAAASALPALSHRSPFPAPLPPPLPLPSPLSRAVHHFVEFNVSIMLESGMEHAFLTPSNRDMTATDTQKNAVYYVAKQCASKPVSPEEFGVALAKHFVEHYPTVWKAKVAGERRAGGRAGWMAGWLAGGGWMAAAMHGHEMLPGVRAARTACAYLLMSA